MIEMILTSTGVNLGLAIVAVFAVWATLRALLRQMDIDAFETARKIARVGDNLPHAWKPAKSGTAEGVLLLSKVRLRGGA